VLREPEQRSWLEGKGQLGGFRPIAFDIRSRGLVKIPRGPGCPVQTHAVVDYEGVLDVTDPIVLALTVDAGIGAAKAFGFGMLSRAPP
jgi:CRISPR system Cascade subunit CasE